MPVKHGVGVLVTSRGSSLDPLIATVHENPYYKISVIITHQHDAPIVARACSWQIPCVVIDKQGKTKSQIDDDIVHCLQQYHVSLVLLVGYMRILSADFVRCWPSINMHPSLLPKHKGLMDLAVHQAVLDNKETQGGVSCHWVTEAVDEGPVIEQSAFPVESEDTAETLKTKAQHLEGQILIQLLNDANLIDQWRALS